MSPAIVTAAEVNDGAVALLKNNAKRMLSLMPEHLQSRVRAMQAGALECVVKAVKTRGINLLEHPDSLVECLHVCARLGLFPGVTMAADCHILPFKEKGQPRSVFVPNYHGLQKLHYQSGMVRSINAGAVREGDDFEYSFGTEAYIRHRKGDKRGELTHAWCVFNLRDGGQIPEVLTREEVLAVKAKAPGGKTAFSPWADAQAEGWMWVKTAVKAAGKRAPRSPELAQVHELDDKGPEQDLRGSLDMLDVENEETVEKPAGPPARYASKAQIKFIDKEGSKVLQSPDDEAELCRFVSESRTGVTCDLYYAEADNLMTMLKTPESAAAALKDFREKGD